jgi:hypothetical protein
VLYTYVIQILATHLNLIITASYIFFPCQQKEFELNIIVHLKKNQWKVLQNGRAFPESYLSLRRNPSSSMHGTSLWILLKN